MGASKSGAKVRLGARGRCMTDVAGVQRSEGQARQVKQAYKTGMGQMLLGRIEDALEAGACQRR